MCQDGPMHSGCLQAIHPVSHKGEWESRTEANKERAAVQTPYSWVGQTVRMVNGSQVGDLLGFAS